MSDKIVPINKGVGNTHQTLYINSDDVRIGMRLYSKGSIAVDVDTIDHEVQRLGLNPGFIKADIEGAELSMIEGASDSSILAIIYFNSIIYIYHKYQNSQNHKIM